MIVNQLTGAVKMILMVIKSNVLVINYRFYVIVRVLPLSILLSPASYYDGELARPLIKKCLTQYSGVLNTKHYAMDSGYDQEKKLYLHH